MLTNELAWLPILYSAATAPEKFRYTYWRQAHRRKFPHSPGLEAKLCFTADASMENRDGLYADARPTRIGGAERVAAVPSGPRRWSYCIWRAPAA